MRCFVLALLIVMLTACGWSRAPEPLQTGRIATDVTIEDMAVGGMSGQDAIKALQPWAASRHQPAKSAGFDPETGEIYPDEPGQTVDLAATVADALQAPPAARLTAAYRPLSPAITVDALRAAKQLGGYSTPVRADEPDRLTNIRLTAALINNVVLSPGEEFSFNRRTGEPTRERGFVEAPVIVDGRREPGLGGGMCQVSSTLYNAVLAAQLEVVERHPHSQSVSYVPPGRDATTYTDKDLRFTNNTRHRLIIRAWVSSRLLRVDLWGLPGE